ncbi:unnamed protein product [Symbiodinium necroappetens]|uniref:Uncharacterized protein n=1 Tax=Symbiodinium necroappetens TaxID=1628268 RepID=A0A812LMA4_9DINO|nr:unnamed protein product [Symbiodinium necroappetens]
MLVGTCASHTQVKSHWFQFRLGYGLIWGASSRYLDPSADGVGGTVSIILLAHQHLAWKLPITLQTRSGAFLREVFWMDLVPFLTYGYRPRFGDNRDSQRRARYHEGDEVVIVRWRRRLNEEQLFSERLSPQFC